MSDYQLMDWQPVRDAYPKVAVAHSRGKEYVVWEQANGYQVAQRTHNRGLRQVRWHQQRHGIADIGTAITLAEQWNYIQAGGTISPIDAL